MALSISDFKSEIDTYGILKSNRYEVEISIPKKLTGWRDISKSMRLRCSSVRTPGFEFVQGSRLLPRAGYGPTEYVPVGVQYLQVECNFLVDANSNVLKFFYDWANAIVNFRARGQLYDQVSEKKLQPYELSYRKDVWAENMTIHVYNERSVSGSSKREMASPVLKYKLYRVLPLQLAQFQMGWGDASKAIEYPVMFEYTDFEVLDTKY